MSTGTVDADVVRNKLDAISAALATLESVGEVNATRLTDEPLVGAAVERLLCRVVDLAVDVNAHISVAALGRSPGDYRESFDRALEAGALTKDLTDELKLPVGLRNAIVHDYVRIDYEAVASSVPRAIQSYGEYRRQIASFVLDGLS